MRYFYLTIKSSLDKKEANEIQTRFCSKKYIKKHKMRKIIEIIKTRISKKKKEKLPYEK